MAVSVKQNKKGFTLIEVMVALVIFSFTMLALLSAVGSLVNLNMRNALRNEALSVADENMIALKTGRSISSPIIRNVMGAPVTYTLSSQSNVMGNVSRIGLTVTWSYKGETYQHSVASISD